VTKTTLLRRIVVERKCATAEKNIKFLNQMEDHPIQIMWRLKWTIQNEGENSGEDGGRIRQLGENI